VLLLDIIRAIRKEVGKGENCFQSSLAQIFYANVVHLLWSLATPAMMGEGKR
jgi:hypothetical protein